MARLGKSQTAEAIKLCPMFSALGQSELADLMRTCTVRHLAAGAQIFSPSPSQPAECFYVILTGKVKVYKLSARGDEQILHLYGPGQRFGEAAMWSGTCYPAFAEAIAASNILVVGRTALKDMIARNTDIALEMLAGMSAKLREFAELIEQLSLREVPARLANILLELPAQSGANKVVLRQTKRQLAAQIGTVSETLSRALKKLSQAGLIEVSGAEITILDPDGLAKLAEG